MVLPDGTVHDGIWRAEDIGGATRGIVDLRRRRRSRRSLGPRGDHASNPLTFKLISARPMIRAFSSPADWAAIREICCLTGNAGEPIEKRAGFFAETGSPYQALKKTGHTDPGRGGLTPPVSCADTTAHELRGFRSPAWRSSFRENMSETRLLGFTPLAPTRPGAGMVSGAPCQLRTLSRAPAHEHAPRSLRRGLGPD